MMNFHLLNDTQQEPATSQYTATTYCSNFILHQQNLLFQDVPSGQSVQNVRKEGRQTQVNGRSIHPLSHFINAND